MYEEEEEDEFDEEEEDEFGLKDLSGSITNELCLLRSVFEDILYEIKFIALPVREAEMMKRKTAEEERRKEREERRCAKAMIQIKAFDYISAAYVRSVLKIADWELNRLLKENKLERIDPALIEDKTRCAGKGYMYLKEKVLMYKNQMETDTGETGNHGGPTLTPQRSREASDE